MAAASSATAAAAAFTTWWLKHAAAAAPSQSLAAAAKSAVLKARAARLKQRLLPLPLTAAATSADLVPHPPPTRSAASARLVSFDAVLMMCEMFTFMWTSLNFGVLTITLVQVQRSHLAPLHLSPLYLSPLHLSPLYLSPLHLSPLHLSPLTSSLLHLCISHEDDG